MTTQRDIENKEDIKTVIDSFYNKVRKDELLGPVFNKRIKSDEWPVHLEVMYSFWNMVLFGEPEYRGNPFSKHLDLGLDSTHFDRWIQNFHATVDESFSGAKAAEMKDRAVRIRVLFESKLSEIANTGMKPLL